MQQTSPFFLFFFLPLSLLSIFFVKQRYRPFLLSLISILYFSLLNRNAPMGLVATAFSCFCTYLSSLLSRKRRPQRIFRYLLGVFFPVCILLITRISVANTLMTYPYGLTMITLSAISTTIDTTRDNAPCTRNPLLFVGKLLYFPTLFVGPVLRHKTIAPLWDAPKPTLSRLYYGIRLYMIGFIKTLVIAAPLLFVYEKFHAMTAGSINVFTVFLVPPVLFFMFCFFLLGASDMARGLSSMCGIPLPCDNKNPFTAKTPAAFFGAFSISFGQYINTYITTPISTRIKRFPQRMVCTLLTLPLCLLLYHSFNTLLFALPLCLLMLLSCIFPQNKHKFIDMILLFFCAICTMLLCSTLPPHPALDLTQALPVWQNAKETTRTLVWLGFAENLYYLAPSALLLAPFLMLHALHKPVVCHKKHGILIYRRIEMILLLFVFAITIMYIMPHYPDLANYLFAGLLL